MKLPNLTLLLVLLICLPVSSQGESEAGIVTRFLIEDESFLVRAKYREGEEGMALASLIVTSDQVSETIETSGTTSFGNPMALIDPRSGLAIESEGNVIFLDEGTIQFLPVPDWKVEGDAVDVQAGTRMLVEEFRARKQIDHKETKRENNIASAALVGSVEIDGEKFWYCTSYHGDGEKRLTSIAIVSDLVSDGMLTSGLSPFKRSLALIDARSDLAIELRGNIVFLDPGTIQFEPAPDWKWSTSPEPSEGVAEKITEIILRHRKRKTDFDLAKAKLTPPIKLPRLKNPKRVQKPNSKTIRANPMKIERD